MKVIYRTYRALFLALILVLTGQSMAVARGASGPAGEMVLCTGTGPVTVFVDENGAPIKPLQYCPDCALTLLVAVPAPDPVLLVMGARRIGLRPLTVTLSHLPSVLRATARGPPRPV